MLEEESSRAQAEGHRARARMLSTSKGVVHGSSSSENFVHNGTSRSPLSAAWDSGATAATRDCQKEQSYLLARHVRITAAKKDATCPETVLSCSAESSSLWEWQRARLLKSHAFYHRAQSRPLLAEMHSKQRRTPKSARLMALMWINHRARASAPSTSFGDSSSGRTSAVPDFGL